MPQLLRNWSKRDESAMYMPQDQHTLGITEQRKAKHNWKRIIADALLSDIQ